LHQCPAAVARQDERVESQIPVPPQGSEQIGGLRAIQLNPACYSTFRQQDLQPFSEQVLLRVNRGSLAE
jgi:hypothetical protein